jgi:hypothetical protein
LIYKQIIDVEFLEREVSVAWDVRVNEANRKTAIKSRTAGSHQLDWQMKWNKRRSGGSSIKEKVQKQAEGTVSDHDYSFY